MDTAVDERFTDLAQAVIDIAREIQLSAARSAPVVPLTQTQGQIMRYVHKNPGCSPSDIADGAGLQRTNVSTALRELRRLGYITSRRDEVDGRAIRVEATPLSEETIRGLTAAWARLLAGAWTAEPVGDENALETVTTALTQVRDRLAAVRGERADGADRADRADRAGNAYLGGPPRSSSAAAHSVVGFSGKG